MAARILRTNRVQASTAVLTSSSEESAFPRAWLRDQVLSKVLRFRLGWDVTAGIYDKIDFNRGGVKVATVAAGNYSTGTALCTAIVAALEAADATPVWACTYSASTKKFTISSDLAFVLLFGTGTNLAKSIHPDLGFATADTASATTQTAGTAVYQSRRWVAADLGSALSVQAGIARYHNSGTGGTYRLRGSSVSGADALTAAAPTVNQLLSGDADIRIAFLATQTLRYWALLIDDTTNQAGYNDLGIWLAGPYDEPSFNYSTDYEDVFEELSGVEIAVGGAQWQEPRADRQRFTLHWEDLLDADKATFIAIKDATAKGKNFFVSLEPTIAAPHNTIYGYRPADMRFPMKGPSPTGSYWDVILPFAEALP
jgi:hypothetical protein